MFPVTITLQNADQLAAVMAALGHGKTASTAASSKSVAAEKPKAEEVKKPETAPAATAPAATQTTAETSAAQEKKADASEKVAVLSVDERAAIIKNLAGNGKRDEVVALLGKYGAKKGSEVKAEDLPAFDAELKAL